MELGIAVYAEPAATIGALSYVESQKLTPRVLAASGGAVPVCAQYAQERQTGFAAVWPAKEKLYIYSTFSDKLGFDSYLIPARGKATDRLLRKLSKRKEPPLHKRLEQLSCLESLLKRAGCTHVLSIFTYTKKDGVVPKMPARRIAIPQGEGIEEAYWYLSRSRNEWLPSLLYMDDDRWKKLYANRVKILPQYPGKEYKVRRMNA